MMNPAAQLELEQVTYRLADTYWVGYDGGSWTWKRAEFFAPKHKGKITLRNLNNGVDSEVEPLTAGYCLAVMAMNRLCWKYYEAGSHAVAKQWADRQFALRNKALDALKQAELTAFLQFID